MEFNLIKFNQELRFTRRKLDPNAPAVELTHSYTMPSTEFVFRNVGKGNAFEVELFTHEITSSQEIIQAAPFNSNIRLLEPGQNHRIVLDNFMFRGCGCMTDQQYWVEYNDINGVIYRSTIQLSAIGKISGTPPKIIRRRTKVFGTHERPLSLRFRIEGVWMMREYHMRTFLGKLKRLIF